MPDQLFLPGFERHPALDVLFFALLLERKTLRKLCNFANVYVRNSD